MTHESVINNTICKLVLTTCPIGSQVSWDEPEMLQNVKRVSPWLVELVSGIPGIHLASPPRAPKRPRPAEFPFEGQLLNPPFPPNPLLAHVYPPPSHHHFLLHAPPYPSSFPFPDGSDPAIQGARQKPFFVPALPDLHLTSLQSSLLYHPRLRRPDDVVGAPAAPTPPARINTDLTIGGGRDDALSIKKPEAVKPAAGGLMLFGQTILTEQQMSLTTSTSSGGETSPAPTTTRTTSSLNWTAAEKGAANASSEGSGSGVIQNSPTNKASSERPHWFRDLSEPGQCKVFMESDTVGRDLDLSALRSFDEFYHRLSEMFCAESADLRSRVLYRCATGEVKHAGDESFR